MGSVSVGIRGLTPLGTKLGGRLHRYCARDGGARHAVLAHMHELLNARVAVHELPYTSYRSRVFVYAQLPSLSPLPVTLSNYRHSLQLPSLSPLTVTLSTYHHSLYFPSLSSLTVKTYSLP